MGIFDSAKDKLDEAMGNNDAAAGDTTADRTAQGGTGDGGLEDVGLGSLDERTDLDEKVDNSTDLDEKLTGGH